MANPEHVELVRKGAAAINDWRGADHDKVLDLSGADLRGWNLKGLPLQSANLESAKLDGANLSMQGAQPTVLISARLKNATLAGANLERALLKDAHLEGASLGKARFAHANLENAWLTGATANGTDFRSASLTGTHLDDAHLTSALFTGASLNNSCLKGANLERADLSKALLIQVDLTSANLRRAKLVRAKLYKATLSGACFALADMKFCEVAETAFVCSDSEKLDAIKGYERAANLETVKCGHGENCWDTESVPSRLWVDRLLDWERLGKLGRLPLLAPSWTVLILIPVVCYAHGLWNAWVHKVQDATAMWATQASREAVSASVRDASTEWLSVASTFSADLASKTLHEWALPPQVLWLFLGTLLLAIGTTLFVLGCPSRIKEFSQTRWCDELGRSRIEYLPLAWSRRTIRILCTLGYGFGIVLTGWVLATKLWRAFWFIWENGGLSLF